MNDTDTIIPQFEFDKHNIGIPDIKQEVNMLLEQGIDDLENKGMLKAMTANEWLEQAKNRPIPRMLFSEMWFESELCILFADTNLGKSILAVQIGNSISTGLPIPGFKMEASKQPILYFDFELTEKQFENRYTDNYTNHYSFDDNFIRVEVNTDATNPDSLSFEEYLFQSIEKTIIERNSKVLIVDNITYLKNETEQSKHALPLMKYLKELKNKFELSILALAHTPKRDNSQPININHIQGSKMLANFMDSSFAIGHSQTDKSIRYIKQIKQRFVEKIYDAENVCVCQINKPSNFLQFEFVDFGSEYDHLRMPSDSDRSQKIADVMEMKKQGKSNIEIAEIYDVTEGAVRKWLAKANESDYE